MKIVGFKTGKPKQFNYKPVFYDERKEELEKLKKKYEQEQKGEGVSPEFKDRLRQAWNVKEKHVGNISRVTMIVYLIVAMLILYLVFLY